MIFISLSTLIYANEGFILSSIEETLQLSEETGKTPLIIFGSDDCRYCLKLKKDLLDNKIPEMDRYIICYVNIKTNPEYKKEYKISLIPDSKILVNKEVKYSMTGYSLENYKKWLKNAKF